MFYIHKIDIFRFICKFLDPDTSNILWKEIQTYFHFFEYVGKLRIIILRREGLKKTKTDYKKQGTQQTQKRQKKRKENEEGNTRKNTD
jgi:hypothetical protein